MTFVLSAMVMPSKDIEAETLNKIDQFYPADLAKGYASSELRGIWVVEMQKVQ